MFMKVSKTIMPQRKKKVLIVFDYLVADMESDEKLSPIVAEFF